ncbi:MAG: alpha/beta hydrolase [Betaproteobacteria bacterium]|nr:alpha/beta hydrolase [Betaproteobacteria bacterium]
MLLAALAGGAALAGCGGPRRWGGEEPGAERADAELRQFAARGYDSAATSIAETWRERLLFRDDEIAVELLAPRQGPPVPLVLYLPGMGETAAAGERWRKAWAAAGYAVAALQSVRASSLWASAASRRGDFAPQALEQFAPQALAERLAQVEFVLHEFARRGTDGLFAQIDLSRVAVAGFDLGAQTALALAGEKHPNLARAASVPGLRAVITLSPYVRISGGLLDRFSDIRIPVLAVTGTEDHDPYGLVDSPLTRRAPFEYMPAGGKWLLVVGAGTHAMLSGSAPTAEADSGDPAERSSRRGAEGEAGRGRSGGPGGSDGPGGSGGPRGSGGPGGMGGRGGMGGKGGGAGGPPQGGPGRSAGQGEGRMGGAFKRHALMVERVSLAFLDANLRSDPIAGEWLARDAARWLGPAVTLRSK